MQYLKFEGPQYLYHVWIILVEVGLSVQDEIIL